MRARPRASLLVVSTTAWLAWANDASAVDLYESFDGPCSPNACGCGAGCGRTAETPYGFDEVYFRTHDTGDPYWPQSVAEAGTGINGSGSFKAVSEAVAPTSQSSCYFGKSFQADGDLYFRGCWRFNDAWDDYALVDQKLYYIYFTGELAGTGVATTLFWHAGSTDNGWAGDGLEVALYSIPGDWCHANAACNQVQHTNRLKLAEHVDQWICMEVHEDLDQPTWQRTLWVTTQAGAQHLPPGTAGLVNGVVEFNDYEYVRQDIDSVAQTMASVKFGAFNNESVGSGSLMWLDEMVLSDNKIGSPFVSTSDTVPAAPTGLQVH